MGLTLSLLFAVAAVQSVAAPQGAPSSGATHSVCEIARDPAAFVGKVVSVSAQYHTDSMHYAYLDDEGCEASLQMGYEVPGRDASVADFEAAENRICVETGSPYLCVLEGKLTLRGEIIWIKGAHLEPDTQTLAINPHSVLTFEFKERSAPGR